MSGAGTQPAPDDSEIRRRQRQPKSKEMPRQRDPDAIEWSTIKSK